MMPAPGIAPPDPGPEGPQPPPQGPAPSLDPRRYSGGRSCTMVSKISGGSSRRGIFVRFANAERCTCGCGYTLAACRAFDSSCDVSAPRVQSLLDSVRAGRIRSAAGIRKRPA